MPQFSAASTPARSSASVYCVTSSGSKSEATPPPAIAKVAPVVPATKPASDKVLLEVRGATKRFGGLQALGGVDLDVREGEILGLVGPNGSGKTTLINVVSGFYPLTSGSVQVDGVEIGNPYEASASEIAAKLKSNGLTLVLINTSPGDAAKGERGRSAWVPAVDVVERDGQLVIRADVPGLNKDQILVEVQDGNLVISGERKEEHEERQSGVYRVERSYGSFYRVVPLPEGVNPEQAKASLANGVLEITMPAPQQPQPRRLEIKEGASAQQSQQAKSA